MATSMKLLKKELAEFAAGSKTRGVYGLADPVTGKVRYIGMSEHCERRYYEHICALRSERTLFKRDWIFGLLHQDLMPALVVLVEIPEGDMREAECAQIQAHELVGEADMNWAWTHRPGKRHEKSRRSMSENENCGGE